MESRSKITKPTNVNPSSDFSTLENANVVPDFITADYPTMTENFTLPSSRVWSNIEKILDEQDNRRKIADSLISSSFDAKTTNRRKFYVAAVAGVSLLAGIFWMRF